MRKAWIWFVRYKKNQVDSVDIMLLNEFIAKIKNNKTTTNKISYLHGSCGVSISGDKFVIITLGALISTPNHTIFTALEFKMFQLFFYNLLSKGMCNLFSLWTIILKFQIYSFAKLSTDKIHWYYLLASFLENIPFFQYGTNCRYTFRI